MKLKSWLVATAVSLARPSCLAQDAPACGTTVEPLVASAPKLPPELHNEYRGAVVVRLIVETSGSVTDPRIITKNLQPVGRSRGEPIGYDQAIIAAASAWRFPRQTHRCSKDQVIIFKFVGDRPNSSFKPNPLRGSA